MQQYHADSKASDSLFPRIHVAILVVVTGGLGLLQYAHIAITEAQWRGDAATVWRPFAQAVLNGATPYTATVWDNKPPLFELLNIVAEATGYYFIAMLLFVTVAHAISAVCLYTLWQRYGRPDIGFLAGILFVAMLAVNGFQILNKPLSTALIMLALIVRGPTRRGLLLGAACMITQYSILAAPLIGLLALHDRETGASAMRASFKFAAGGALIVAINYGSLAILYNVDTAIRALGYSSGFTGQYATTQNHIEAFLLASPISWSIGFIGVAEHILFVLLPALVGGYHTAKRLNVRRLLTLHPPALSPATTLLLLVVTVSPSLIIRFWGSYWLQIYPALAGLAALGITELLTTTTAPSGQPR